MDQLRIDDEHVRWAVGGRAASADEAITALADRPLLLLMHGYGSFEGDLIELAPRLPRGFVCASPRAPLVAPPPIVDGFAWWSLPLGPDGLPRPAVRAAEFAGTPEHRVALATLEWIDALDARVAAAAGDSGGDSGGGEGSGRAGARGIGSIALMGFSQGGCMVTSLLRLRAEGFACGVNCSGFVAPGSFAGDAELARARPPMFWGRDEADPIVDHARIELTSAWAPAHTALEARLYEGIAHGIGAEELLDISAFLDRHVPGATV